MVNRKCSRHLPRPYNARGIASRACPAIKFTQREITMNGRFLTACMLGMMVWASCGHADGSAAKALPSIRFYKDNGGTGTNVCTATLDSSSYFVKRTAANLGCGNDNIRSMKLQNIPVGTTITLYDSAPCGDDDDWTSTKVTAWKQGGGDIIIDTLEATKDWTSTGGNRAHSEYHRKDGLDGKVSCLIIDTGDRPIIRLYSQGAAGGENFCVAAWEPSLPAFSMSMSYAGCTNDHARSMKLHNFPPGSEVDLYDSPNCGDSDDWQRITILARAGSSDIVNNVEADGTFSDTSGNKWKASFHRHNGLYASVSCLSWDVPH